MEGSKGLGQLLGECLARVRDDTRLSQQQVARRARRVGLPWTAATVNAFESGRRQAVALDELILLSRAFRVEPAEWFAGAGWAELTPDDRASLGVIRTVLAGSELDSWQRIGDRAWEDPRFRDAPGVLRAQFERLHARLRVAQDYLGPGVCLETAIRAVHAASGDLEVRAAYRYHVEPLQVSLEAFKNWGRGLTQERDRRFGVFAREVSFRFLRESRGHISRGLVREIAPKLQHRRLKPYFGGLLIEA